MALKPEAVHAANRRSVQFQNARDQWVVRPGTAGVMMEQDMAGTNGPLISPDMFRDLCLPYLAQRIVSAKRYAPQVVFHNCGNNIPLMEMFIQAGIDCYQSLQTTAGMEVGKLKEMFGSRMAFWGGVGVEKLISGTPDDVRAEVRTAMRRGAPGSGFILGPSHSIAKNTRYDNFMAMLDEFVKLRDKY
jgi:uroporphyrinogen decarboxylase